MAEEIPEEVFAEIVKQATEHWNHDVQLQRYVIAEEEKAYFALINLDFGQATFAKSRICSQYARYSSWKDKIDYALNEINAAAELSGHNFDGVDPAALAKIKAGARSAHQLLVEQLEYVEARVKEYRFAIEARAKYGEICQILRKMENIVGSECYNDNIQNYSSWGEWESAGRGFRYPVMIYDQFGPDRKVTTVPANTSAEALIRGYYKFGANELNIFRALVKIIEMLENDYGFVLPHNGNV